jgi:hypothetical protein
MGGAGILFLAGAACLSGQQLVAPQPGLFREGVVTAPAAGVEASAAPVDGRVDARVDAAVSAPSEGRRDTTEPTRSRAFKAAVTASAEYNDNIFLSSENAESDFVFRVGIPLAYVRGREGEEGFFSRVGYTPTGVVYASNPDATRIDHEAVAAFGWEGGKSALSYEGDIKRLGEASADVGAQYDRTEWKQAIRVAWKPREKVRLEAVVGQENFAYDDAGLSDSEEIYAGLVAKYAWKPKTSFRAAYRGGRLSVDGSGDQDIHSLAVGMNWQPREKLRFDFTGGIDHRSFAAGSSTTPLLAATAAWTPRDGTELSLQAYRRVEASAFLPGENYTLTGASAAISQRLGRRWTGTLEGGIEQADYSDTSGEGSSGREDTITFVRPGLAYRFNDTLSMLFFLSLEQNDSNLTALGYENLRAGVRLNYEF